MKTRSIVPFLLLGAVAFAVYLAAERYGLNLFDQVEPAVTKLCTYVETRVDPERGEVDVYNCGRHGRKDWSVRKRVWLREVPRSQERL